MDVFARRGSLVIAVGMLTLVIQGCGKQESGPPTFPVRGVVTWQKQPLAGASVVFYPADGSNTLKPAQATTDAEGKFTVKIHVQGNEYKDGMQPGDYRVTVSKTEPQPPGVMLPPRELLPAQYTTPQRSPFQATVSSTTPNEFDFPL